jgi:RNase P subunit RPR2
MADDDIVRRQIKRTGECRGCGDVLVVGTEIVYTYSTVGRGTTVILCLPCAEIIGNLANQ